MEQTPVKRISRNGSIKWGIPTGKVMTWTGERIIRGHRSNMPAYINPEGVTIFILDGTNRRALPPDERAPSSPAWEGMNGPGW